MLPLEGNVLDLAFVYANRGGAGPVAAVSVDHVHKRGSTSELRSEQVSKYSRVNDADGE